MTGSIIFVATILYLGIGVFISDMSRDDSHIILWPLLAAKRLLKGLYKILFTDGRD